MEKMGLGVTTTVDGFVRVAVVDELGKPLGVEVLYTPEEAVTLATAITKKAKLAATLSDKD